MKKLKYDLAMAAAQVKVQTEYLKNPNLKISQAMAVNFFESYKEFSSETGEEFLKAAARALNVPFDFGERL